MTEDVKEEGLVVQRRIQPRGTYNASLNSRRSDDNFKFARGILLSRPLVR